MFARLKSVFASKNFAKFLLVGCLNTAVDFALFNLFATAMHWNPVAANVLSTVLTMTMSYALNSRFVFQSRPSKQSALQFVGVTLFNGWIVQSLVIWLAGIVLPHWDVFANSRPLENATAKVCAIGAALLLNFLGYRLVFGVKPATEAAVAAVSDEAGFAPPPAQTRER